MPSPGAAYQGTVRTLSVLFLVIGAAILATTIANGGGPLSIGVVLGLAFLAVGAGRLWAAARMSR